LPLSATGKVYNCCTIESLGEIYSGVVKEDKCKTRKRIVMNEQEKRSKEWISIRVKPEEYNKIYKFYQETTCRKLSEYIRKILLKKPIKVNYRDQSAEDLLEMMNQLKNELNAVGNNFNQSIKKLHGLNTIAEIKVWIMINEPLKQTVLKKIEEIRIHMKQIFEQWSQK
jgi:hypothetical protein